MEDWKKRPLLIDYWEEDIDTVMAIDENGTTDLTGVRNLFAADHLELMKACFHTDSYMHERWFTITGVIMDRGNFPSFKDAITTIKLAHWHNGLYDYKQGQRRVVFHSREIRKKEGPFNPKLIKTKDFVMDISSLIKNQNFDIYSSSIDKIKHIARYTKPFHVYNLCLNFIVERYCRELNRKGKTGILLLESRGKDEDAMILEYLVDLLENGNNYHTAEHFSQIKGVYFNPKWCFNKNHGKASFILLELADIVSYPIFKYIKTNKKDIAFEVLEPKLQNYPSYNGYGIKKFP